MTMKTAMTEDYKTRIDFLADYASWLWGCGATCARLEKNVARMAEAFGIETDLSVMPSHVQIVGHNNDCTCIAVRKTVHCGINFDINTRLSRLSWEIADGKIDFEGACKSFSSIIRTGPTGKWQVLLLASIANASFCRLFGGDFVSVLIVFVATLAGYRLKQIMLDDGRDIRLTFICAAFFSSAISAGGHIFGLGATPEIALGTSVLYLIPGVPYINSVSDLWGRHYLCALWRFTDAFILTACLSLGLCAGMLILGFNWF